MVLARKYRPKNFKELIGQEAICEILTLALDKKQLSFAYLFSGLRGSGKTSTARIFAKSLICQKGISSEPCEECSNCKMANSGSHMDIIEIDAASNRRIDDIRELIEHTKYKPALARYKVFIIDEVHMLTKEAFNALLKTLEEPPEFVKFILATTDPLKLPATILSRTQHFRFRKISNITLQRHLENILKKEQVEFESRAVETIVRFSEGSVRDALTLLDQAIIYSKGFLDAKSITEMLGTLNIDTIEELIENILNQDIEKIREFIEKNREFEAETIINELILYLKDILLNNPIKLSYLILDRFFKILEEAKRLLSIGSDEEFVLVVTLFKMANIDYHQNQTKIEKVNRKKLEENIENIPKKELEDKIIMDNSSKKEIDKNLEFKALIEKLYKHNSKLGEIFEKNIKFISFENKILTWESKAIDKDREFLKHKFGQIRMYVREVYGDGVKIKNISKIPKAKEKIEKPIEPKKEEKVPMTTEERLHHLIKQEPILERVIELFEPKNVILDYYEEKKDEVS